MTSNPNIVLIIVKSLRILSHMIMISFKGTHKYIFSVIELSAYVEGTFVPVFPIIPIARKKYFKDLMLLFVKFLGATAKPNLT